MIYNINTTIFPLKKGLSALDIGCAEGANSIELKKDGYNVSSIEIDPALVETFKAKPEAEGIDIRVGDALHMPYKDNSFDRAILIEVIEHITPTDELLQEISRVMKPGGILCIGVPTGYTENIYWRLHPKYASNATHVKIFSREDLIRHIGKNGFKIHTIETKNFVPAVSWFFHALLRSHSDHTGKIYNHLWIDSFFDRLFGAWSRTPGLRRVYGAMSRRVGKSWYFYCEKI